MRSVVTLGLTLWMLCAFATGPARAQAPAAAAKATLRVDKLPLEPLDVAVFDPAAARFDQPLAFFRGVGAAGVQIPAGDLLIALRSGRKAPDLHLLQVKPGSVVHLEFRPVEGWSLFARVRSSLNGAPVPSAVVSTGAASRPQTTGPNGMVIFPGIAANAVDVEVHHPDFVPQTMPGVSGASGALAFREITLEAGGHVRAAVRVKGQPRVGVRCVMTLRRSRSEERTVYEGRTNAQGICQTERVAAGAYLFSVQLAAAQGPVQHAVLVTDGQDTEEDFSLSEIRVHGTITRGPSPAPGITVRAMEGQKEAARTATGPDGTYVLTLARAGRYRMELLPGPKASPALERGVVVSESGDNTVDFALQEGLIEGSIIDARGRPIEGAWVRLRWNELGEVTEMTDKDGRFTFYLEAFGSGVLMAGKDGYGDAPVQELEVDQDDYPVPVVLTLNKVGSGGGDSGE
jgi:hypothetical protein